MITLAIHTYERAVFLKRILENHGIEVVLETLKSDNADIAAGVEIKIKLGDIPHALRIVESVETISTPNLDVSFDSKEGTILIPVDFNPYSLLACRMGFALAQRLSLHPVILHAYATPYFSGVLNYDDTMNAGLDPGLTEEFSDIVIGNDIRKESEVKMIKLRKSLEQMQKDGKLPDLRFKTSINEGVAEDVIKEYCRLTPPSLIVMATRDIRKKDSELVGSVTAEVLDSCRVPVFSVPETGHFEELENIKKLVFFCDIDQQDIISMDTLMRMFDYPEIDVTLIPVNTRIKKNIEEKMRSLCNYFNKTYPDSHFKVTLFNTKNFYEDFRNFESQIGVEMIVVPNRRRNIFARLMNPGIAHRLLFERDLPLLALPV